MIFPYFRRQFALYFYDGRSRLERVVNARGQALRHFYQPWGGLERVVHDLTNDGEDSGDRVVSYTYDANGNVTSTKDTDPRWSWEFLPCPAGRRSFKAPWPLT